MGQQARKTVEERFPDRFARLPATIEIARAMVHAEDRSHVSRKSEKFDPSARHHTPRLRHGPTVRNQIQSDR
jgi:hypothetical protein